MFKRGRRTVEFSNYSNETRLESSTGYSSRRFKVNGGQRAKKKKPDKSRTQLSTVKIQETISIQVNVMIMISLQDSHIGIPVLKFHQISGNQKTLCYQNSARLIHEFEFYT